MWYYWRSFWWGFWCELRRREDEIQSVGDTGSLQRKARHCWRSFPRARRLFSRHPRKSNYHKLAHRYGVYGHAAWGQHQNIGVVYCAIPGEAALYTQYRLGSTAAIPLEKLPSLPNKMFRQERCRRKVPSFVQNLTVTSSSRRGSGSDAVRRNFQCSFRSVPKCLLELLTHLHTSSGRIQEKHNRIDRGDSRELLLPGWLGSWHRRLWCGLHSGSCTATGQVGIPYRSEQIPRDTEYEKVIWAS